uniref:Uncharacterized protein n=1 Tax=Triticum urartu TaxID=4572 RepID=A0A8R7PPK3_TRIUA
MIHLLPSPPLMKILVQSSEGFATPLASGQQNHVAGLQRQSSEGFATLLAGGQHHHVAGLQRQSSEGFATPLVGGQHHHVVGLQRQPSEGFATPLAGGQHHHVAGLQRQFSEVERSCFANCKSRADASVTAIIWPMIRTSTQRAANLRPLAKAMTAIAKKLDKIVYIVPFSKIGEMCE